MRILVGDDEERFARLVADDLKDSGHEVAVLTSGADAAREAGSGYDVVITDLKMTPVDGLGVLEAVKAASPETEVVVMTAFGAVDVAVEAMKKGAADFITKPFAMDQLHLRLERIAGRLVLKRENQALKLEAGIVMQLISAYDWPGNVRELENVLERAIILSGGAEIRPQHIQLPEPVLARPKPGETGGAKPSGVLHDVERTMLEDAMRKAGGNKSKAAKLLGITRRMLYTKLERYGLTTGESPNDESSPNSRMPEAELRARTV